MKARARLLLAPRTFCAARGHRGTRQTQQVTAGGLAANASHQQVHHEQFIGSEATRHRSARPGWPQQGGP
eukprot:14899495-Alexandrium_andersonii.AAC.1